MPGDLTTQIDAALGIDPHVSQAQRRDHAVVLVHGIRTQAEWFQRVAGVLQEDPSIRAIPTRYEFLDLLRFLIPLKRFRRKPTNRVVKLIRDELHNKRTKRVSVIAHSFGTWIVSEILEHEPEIDFHRLILCGSVIPDGFEWGNYRHRTTQDDDDGWQVINDCGSRDIWPVFALSATWGYGSSGRFGFGHPRVKDRFHDVAHGEFFSAAFARKYWLPYLSNGTVVEGMRDRAQTPWLLSLLTVLKVKYLVVALIFAGIVFPGRAAGIEWSRIPGYFSAREDGGGSPEAAAEPLKPEDFRLPDCKNPPRVLEASPRLECVETPDQWVKQNIWNLALLYGAAPSASSNLSAATNGYHRTEYLNDGWYNNGRSWIPDQADGAGHCNFPVRASIRLPGEYSVYAVALTNEMTVMHNDRGALDLTIQTIDAKGVTSMFAEMRNQGPLRRRREFTGNPVRAQQVTVTIQYAQDGTCPRLDEIEVMGKK